MIPEDKILLNEKREIKIGDSKTLEANVIVTEIYWGANPSVREGRAFLDMYGATISGSYTSETQEPDAIASLAIVDLLKNLNGIKGALKEL